MAANFRDPNMKKAYETGGYRERYAMEHGSKTVRYMNGKVLWRFTYSKYDPYQDANGAEYSVKEGRWIN